MARGATARLFAAVDPPAAVREQLAWWAREVAGTLRAGERSRDARGRQRGRSEEGGEEARIRLLAPETMHVTLCFLGSRPVEELQALADALARCELPPGGSLSLGAPLWLPPRNPRSLALEIGDGNGWLALLQRALVDAFARTIDWEPERRRFRAHLTVARLGRAMPSRRRARAGARGGPAEPSAVLPPTPQMSFVPESVVLYRSWLGPQGASYEALAARALDTSSSDSPSSSSSPGEDAP
jgi:RNA 2',3'-cyclic 3'-phosphodiesterase